MNQNIFKSAIRDVRNSTYNNNDKFRSTMKLDKKNVGKEFTEEIDFEQESLNLGEDNVAEEILNDNVKVTKLRSSIVANAKNPYPISFDRKIEIRKNNENINSILSNSNIANKEIVIPKKNKNLVIKNIHNQEIIIYGDCANTNYIKGNSNKNKNENSHNNMILNIIDNNNENSKHWKHDKFNESVLLKYSIFIRNLPMNITDNKLRDIFSLCGPIISLYVRYNLFY
jgi:hypothetical protein